MKRKYYVEVFSDELTILKAKIYTIFEEMKYIEDIKEKIRPYISLFQERCIHPGEAKRDSICGICLSNNVFFNNDYNLQLGDKELIEDIKMVFDLR